MKRATTCLLSLVPLAAIFGAGGCEKARKKTEYQYAITLGSQLALDVRFPGLRTESEACPGVQSWLLRIDMSGDPAWDYTFLFSSDHQTLYGCGGANLPCDARELGFAISETPARAMLEGLTIAPELYATATSGIDVICRGIADADVVASDIITTDLFPGSSPTPEPGPVATTVPGRQHTVTLRMLTVGDSNPLPYVAAGDAPPQTRYGAAASFSNFRHGIAMSPSSLGAGRVVLAGGVAGTTVQGEVWEFDPQALTFTHTTNLGTARVGLTATSFMDDGGSVGIVYAGGATDSLPKTRMADVYWPNGTIESEPLALVTARSFHSATYFPRPTNGPVVGLIGGGDYNAKTNEFGGNETNTSEYFLPKGSVSADNCLLLETWQFCVPSGSDTLTQSRMRHGAPFYEAGGGAQAWIAGGQQGPAGRNDGQIYAAGDSWDFGAAANLIATAVAPATAMLTSSGNSSLNFKPISIGGYADGNPAVSIGAQDRGSYRDAAVGIVSLTDFMTFPRGDATATELRDKTVLIAGGRNDIAGLELGVQTFERLVPATSTTPAGAIATFEYLALPGATCVDGTGTGCAGLLSPRYGHTATRLDATATWLDGAVLIIGGAEAGPPAELFVPAITCDPTDHLTPVSPVTHVAVEPLSNATLPALCDRDRAGSPITDPSNPPS